MVPDDAMTKLNFHSFQFNVSDVKYYLNTKSTQCKLQMQITGGYCRKIHMYSSSQQR